MFARAGVWSCAVLILGKDKSSKPAFRTWLSAVASTESMGATVDVKGTKGQPPGGMGNGGDLQ